MARCGCGSGSCSCQFVASDTINIVGTGSAGAPYVASLAQLEIEVAWSGAAEDLTELESQRRPMPACQVTRVEVTAVSAGVGVVDTELQLALNGTPVGPVITLASGATSVVVDPVSPMVLIGSGALLSVVMPGTVGTHSQGLVLVTCQV